MIFETFSLTGQSGFDQREAIVQLCRHGRGRGHEDDAVPGLPQRAVEVPELPPDHHEIGRGLEAQGKQVEIVHDEQRSFVRVGADGAQGLADVQTLAVARLAAAPLGKLHEPVQAIPREHREAELLGDRPDPRHRPVLFGR